MRRLACAATAVMALAPVMVSVASGQSFCRYEITAIIEGPSCGLFGPALVELKSINDLGQACGFYRDCGTFDKRPFAWSEETGFVILPLPPGATNGEAVDINNVLGSDSLGQVVCTLGGPTFGNGRAFLYDDGVWTMLPPLDGGNSSSAAALNDRSQIAGSRSSPVTAYRWENGSFINIPSVIGGTSAGNDVNQRGDVVGYFGNIITGSDGFLWERGVASVIPPLPGAITSVGNALNGQPIVVGYSRIPVKSGQVPTRAWTYENEQLIPIPHPDGYNRSTAVDINDSGQLLIGASTLPPVTTIVFLYQHGEMVPIEDLVEPVPGVLFGDSSPIAINNRGQIGAVVHVIGATNAGAILTPIDQPPGDVNFDCAVDEHDLAAVLRDWGPCPGVGSCISDIVTSATFQPPGDGKVDGADLAVVLGNWTAAYEQPAGSRPR